MPRADRLSLLGLALAMSLSAGLLLWVGRDFLFFHDELAWFSQAPADYRLTTLLNPFNNHLIAVPLAAHATLLHLFGPDYLPWRLLAVMAVLLCAGLFFLLARRRIGAVALLPTVVLLFLGSSWDTVVSPVGLPFLLAVAGGLGALLALERGDRRGDVGACALLGVSVTSHSLGLSFLVGAAVAVLLSENRLRRAWVFALPLSLYAVWWVLWPSPSVGSETLVQASNLLLVPVYGGIALGVALAAITGLNLEVDPTTVAGFNRIPEQSWLLIPLLVVAAVVLLLMRLRRGQVHPSMWVFLATLVAFLASIGLSAGSERPPTAARYAFPAAVVVLLVAAEAARGVRISRRAMAGLVALTCLSLAVNLIHIREATRFLDAYAANAGPTLAMVELASREVAPGFRPARMAPRASPATVAVSAEQYLGAVGRWGSIAPSLQEVSRRPAVIRNRADVVLARALRLRLVPARRATPPGRCTTVGASEAGRTTFELPPGGALLRSRGKGGEVTVRRFGDGFSASVGVLQPGGEAVLRVPEDRASEPWEASFSGGAVEVCDLPGR